MTNPALTPRLEAILAKAIRMAIAFPNVIGVDYGFVYKDGHRLKSMGIRFHVTGKLPLSKLSFDQVLPEKISAVRSDVIEARYSLHASPFAECDPLAPGISIGNLTREKSGTLGMFVTDSVTARPAFLSNWHVLCGSSDAQTGDPISQPAPRFLGVNPPRIIATLHRWLPLDTGSDAAIALLADNVALSQNLFGQTQPVTGVEAPMVGMKVVKFGVTSGFTHGIVDGIGGSFQLNYSNYGDTTRWIDGIRIIPDPDSPDPEISLAGDSGAVWLNPSTNNAVALHFAGEDGLGPLAEYALAQPLPRLLNLLHITAP